MHAFPLSCLLENPSDATDIIDTDYDDDKKAASHNKCLETISPNHSFNSPLGIKMVDYVKFAQISIDILGDSTISFLRNFSLEECIVI